MSVTDAPSTEKQGRVKSPPQPIDEDKKGKFTLPDSKWFWISLVVLAVLGPFAIGYFLNNSSEVNSAADIATVYDHAIILQAREGDTLESAALAVFPNTLIEERVREDGLSDDAKDLERQRYEVEWQRLSRLLTGTTGTTLTPGEFFAVPAKPDEPGAIEVAQIDNKIRLLNQDPEALPDSGD